MNERKIIKFMYCKSKREKEPQQQRRDREGCIRYETHCIIQCTVSVREGRRVSAESREREIICLPIVNNNSV